MEMEFINQALKLTVQELTNKLVDETLAKNLLAIQLMESQAKVKELELLLDEKTNPVQEGE
ncbi:hypothetical protein ABG807_07275 [Streptococcus iniae]